MQFIDTNGLQADLNGGRLIPFADTTLSEYDVGNLIDTSPYPEEYTVFAHGNEEFVKIGMDLSPEDMRRKLRLKGWKEGQDVRLLVCNTGKGTDSFAKKLADLLKVTVTAPSDYLRVDENGKIIGIYPKLDNGQMDYSSPGTWNTFNHTK